MMHCPLFCVVDAGGVGGNTSDLHQHWKALCRDGDQWTGKFPVHASGYLPDPGGLTCTNQVAAMRSHLNACSENRSTAKGLILGTSNQPSSNHTEDQYPTTGQRTIPRVPRLVSGSKPSAGSDTDSTSNLSLSHPVLTPRWNASPRAAGATTSRAPRQSRSRRASGKRRTVPRHDAAEGPLLKPLTPSRTEKLRASEKFVQAAEAAARQAVCVILQSMPKLRRMLRDVGCAPREG